MKSRIFGLDLLRALAIILVLFGHLGQVGLNDDSYIMYLSGFYGVELFFVLSGFLIGQILIKQAKIELSFKSIKEFWVKRWMRTLPLYYLILLLRILYDSTSFPYLHFTFLQNSNIVSDYNSVNWFGESWSLAVEEYFYLAIPILLVLLKKVFSNPRKYTAFSIYSILAISLIIRLVLVYTDYSINYEDEIRKFTFIRLDSLCLGVFIAYLKIYRSSIYTFIQNKVVLISSFLLLIGLNWYGNLLVYDFVGEKLVPSTIGIIANSFLLALLIPFLDGIREFRKNKIVFNFIHYTALFSYCIYLVHLPLYHLIIGEPSVNSIWVLQMVISFVVIYFIGYLSFYYFEQPILKLRNKIYST